VQKMGVGSSKQQVKDLRKQLTEAIAQKDSASTDREGLSQEVKTLKLKCSRGALANKELKKKLEQDRNEVLQLHAAASEKVSYAGQGKPSRSDGSSDDEDSEDEKRIRRSQWTIDCAILSTPSSERIYISRKITGATRSAVYARAERRLSQVLPTERLRESAEYERKGL
jgi:hypothetical protein